MRYTVYKMTDTSNSSKLTFLTPLMSGWILALLFGVIIPLFFQNIIADNISHLSTKTPDTAEELVPTDPMQVLVAASILFVFVTIFVLINSYHILLIAKTRKMASVFALVVTLVGPLFIWLVVPYILAVLA
jgi:glucan phosphoethanolaminetransferase (alkaline phosphatase superfamily)